MSKKIGIRLYLDGATKFNSDIKTINASLKQFQSELKLNDTQFKESQNSLDALSKKSEVLNKAYETAGQKVETYARRLEELNKIRQTEQDRLREYQTALDTEKKKLEEIEKTQGKNSEAYQKQTTVVAGLEEKIKTAGDALSRYDTEEIKLNTSINNATAEQLKYGTELEKTNGYLAEADKNSDRYATSIDKYGRTVDTAAEKTSKISDALDGIIRSEAFNKISEGAQKIIDDLMECAEVAEKFEYSMAKVQSIAQVSGEDLGKMSSEIRRVSTEMGYGVNEIAEATYQAISASVDASEAVGFVEDATKLARAGFTETTTSVDVLTTALNAYGKEANTTAHIADDLITTQNLGKTTVDELAQSIGTIIPTAAALNVSLDQVSTGYVLLTKQGINTANATTYLRAMLNELSDSGSNVSDTLADLTGHTFGELMQKGYTLGDVMQILGDSVEGNGEAFKNLFSNVRSGLGALSLFNQGADAFNDTLKLMENNAGATDKAFSIMADTAEMTNAKFEASAENLKIAVGESLSPTIEMLKKMGITVLDFITGVVERNPKLVSALAGAAVAAGVAATAVTGLAMAISICKAAFGDYTGLIMMATVGVTAAAGAVAGLGASTMASSSEVDKLAESLRSSAEEAEKIVQNAEDLIQSQKYQTEYTQGLIDRIKELNSEETLSENQKRELSKAANELNDSIGETVIMIDDETGKLIDCVDGWEEYAKAQERAAQSKALQESLNDVLAESAKKGYELWEIDEKLSENREKLANITKTINEMEAERAKRQQEGLGTGFTSDEVREIEKLQEEYNKLLETDLTLIDGRKDLAEKAKELADQENNLRGYISEVTEETLKQNDAETLLKDTLGVVKESSTEVEAANKAIEDSMNAASEAISKQIGLFDEWNQKSDLTLGKMQERWKDQTEGITQYKDDLIYLKGVIDAETDPAIEDLAYKMANMGVDGAAEIHNFVEGLKEIGSNTEELEKLADTWNDHLEAISEAENIYAAIQLQEQNYVEDSTALFTQYYADNEAAMQEYNDVMTQMAETGVSDLASAIETNASEVQTATETMMNNALKSAKDVIGMSADRSTAYNALGQNIVNSIADGIRRGEGAVGSALGEVLQNAANNVDVSGIADKVNSQIASSINGAGASFVGTLKREARMGG